MPRPQPGEVPPSLVAAIAVHRMNGVERRVQRWLESDPPPEHRQRVAALILGREQ